MTAEATVKFCGHGGCNWRHYLISDSEPAQKIYEIEYTRHIDEVHGGKAAPNSDYLNDLLGGVFGRGAR